jgi:hypothetical protein
MKTATHGFTADGRRVRIDAYGELVEAAAWIPRCAKMRGPYGTTVYFISDKAMEALRKALRAVEVEESGVPRG